LLSTGRLAFYVPRLDTYLPISFAGVVERVASGLGGTSAAGLFTSSALRLLDTGVLNHDVQTFFSFSPEVVKVLSLFFFRLFFFWTLRQGGSLVSVADEPPLSPSPTFRGRWLYVLPFRASPRSVMMQFPSRLSPDQPPSSIRRSLFLLFFLSL